MGLFEFFSKITHPAKRNGWVEMEAVFTEDGERLEWYDFYPLPDPDPESIKDSSIRIRYNKKSRGYLRQ